MTTRTHRTDAGSIHCGRIYCQLPGRDNRRLQPEDQSGFDAISEYVQSHYKINSHSDTEYWIDNHENNKASEQLSTLLEYCSSAGDLESVLEHYQTSVAYLKPSWYNIFSGMGLYLNADPNQTSRIEPSPTDMAAIYYQEMAAMFSDHCRFLDSQ